MSQAHEKTYEDNRLQALFIITIIIIDIFLLKSLKVGKRQSE